MPRTFICSTATSAAKLLVDDAGNRLAPGKLRQWVRDQERDGVRRAGDINPPSFPRQWVLHQERDGVGTGFRSGAAARMLASFQGFEPVGEALTEKLSAEIHSEFSR